MRRADKEIKDQETIIGILKGGDTLHIAAVEGSRPYIFTVNYGFDGENIFFHSAKQGRKINILKQLPTVSFQVITENRIAPETTGCRWTCLYTSVYGEGKAEFLDDFDEKVYALNALMKQYGGEEEAFPRESVDSVEVIRIVPEVLTGKTYSPK
ncbi:pyridoxamine 5'-phosphate oxidase family protein [Limisalsivibrio acetivorans]|uniref:pyridoxamine 5'-phosphate oxidase family protein n=1 Tax=Limisalsivibrio acetivorans TaxID=1304888 RepID=UPI0003B77D52|nr:pyridoxamine 5'-phosphate oxidase family protein [Limisalsivibrio acetivorans]